MGNCIYCGQKVGLFKSVHPECQEKRNIGLDNITYLLPSWFKNERELSTILQEANNIASTSFIKDNEIKEKLLKGLDILVNSFFDDGIITEEEENYYDEATKALKLTNEELSNSSTNLKIVKGSILRDLTNGEIVSRINVDGNIPIVLGKDEIILWVFNSVELLEMKTIRTYVGGTVGTSVRIAKGLYLRTSSFKGNPIEHEEMVSKGCGSLIITSKNLFFYGAKTLKIGYKKFLSLSPYSDGFGFQKDTTTSKPQAFKVDDGWFAYNLVMNLIELNK